MMHRLDATRIAVELAGESPIIGGVGNSTFDLVPFDRPRNFYMWNSMDIASVKGVARDWEQQRSSVQVSTLRKRADA